MPIGNPVQRARRLGLLAPMIVVLALGAARALAGTYYLSPAGNDGTGDGSRATPCPM